MWTPGQQLGRFKLDREIGQGSHGVVWLATDTALSSHVAIKILHPWLTEDIPVRDRFKRELLLARRIAHPGICRLFDLHEEAGAFFITMDYVQGETLLNILKREGRLSPARATKIMRGVCSALSAAHHAGVIHRDLKPANIIVKERDEPMILDFGTATAQDVSRVTRPGTAVGSMRFIAPEVFTGTSPSVSTDIYSLGVVAYVSIAGRLPYNAAAGAVEMLEMIRGQVPMRLDALEPDVPPRLADVVARAMHRDPTQRFASASAFDEGLASVELEIGNTVERQVPTSADFARWAPSAVIRASVPPTEPVVTALNERHTLGDPQTIEASAVQHLSADGPGDSPADDAPAGPALSEEPTRVQRPPLQVLPPPPPVHPPPSPIRQEPPPSDVTVVLRSPPEPTVRVARFDIEALSSDEASAVGKSRLLPVAAAAAVLTAVVVGVLVLGDEAGGVIDAGAAIPVIAMIADAGAAVDVDAGALAMAADAGAPVAVIAAADAGPEAALDDAGVGLAFTDEDFEEPEDPAPRVRPKTTDPAINAIKQVRVSMLRRGFIPGDLPPAEVLLAKARAASRAGRSGEADRLIGQARGIIDAQNLDRSFVLAKLNRFNTRFDRNTRPDIAGKVEPLAREAGQSFAAGQFDVANQKLNRAFALIGR